MTLFTDEAASSPTPPGVSELAGVIAELQAQSRSAGRRVTKRLTNGLELGLNAEGPLMVLSRADGPASMDEAAICARDAGWPHFGTEWFVSGEGKRYLLIRPRAADEPATQAAELPPDYPGDDVVRELLLDRTAPWRVAKTSPGAEIRDGVVGSMSSADLVAEYGYLQRKWRPHLTHHMKWRAGQQIVTSGPETC